MHFRHADALWRDFPALVPGVLYAEGITADALIERLLQTVQPHPSKALDDGGLPKVAGR